ncbi:MAG: methyltransferase domain-containing protein [Acidobacteriaceae bacterium]|nr:methyltransferase domain-containing protein [Acidobacteriaceae bacterium]MBV9302589.1 methyltransferase domain-containing protein [Acidobacteriaceae bacterium]
MVDQAIKLSEQQKQDLLQRYGSSSTATIESLTYGTVRDFCDSRDHIPYLSSIQGDLKDLQRPAALKAILKLCAPGSSLLEIGAGEPHVAHILCELGYKVTVVDPYDGSGRGPQEFEYYQEKYPDITIIRDIFSDRLTDLERNSFDCIYSISVLEHVPQNALPEVFDGVRHFLKIDGYSLHIVDHVLAGSDSQFHLLQLAEVLNLQAALSSDNNSKALYNFAQTLHLLTSDIDTYYLSAEGHNLWRGAVPYDQFPFRKVVSVQSCARYVKKHPRE